PKHKETHGTVSNPIAPSQLGKPILRDTGLTPDCAGQLAGDRSHGVGIVTKIGGHQDGVAKISSAVNPPQRRFERMHDIAGRRDRTTHLVTVVSVSDRRNFRMAFKPTWREQRLSIRAAYCIDQDTSEKCARVNCCGSRMGSEALSPGNIDGSFA